MLNSCCWLDDLSASTSDQCTSESLHIVEGRKSGHSALSSRNYGPFVCGTCDVCSSKYSRGGGLAILISHDLPGTIELNEILEKSRL